MKNKLAKITFKSVVFIFLLLIVAFLVLFYIYANLFLTINEEQAWKIAHEIINEKYEYMCDWWFNENISLRKYTVNAVFEFSADSKNGNCNVIIFMSQYGSFDSYIGAN